MEKIGLTPIRYQGTLISPYYRTAQSDSSGYWFMDLFPNVSLTPAGSEYEFMIYYEPGRIARKRNHPQAEAINVCGWWGAITLGILSPLAFIWAYTRPCGTADEADRPSDRTKPEELQETSRP